MTRRLCRCDLTRLGEVGGGGRRTKKIWNSRARTHTHTCTHLGYKYVLTTTAAAAAATLHVDCATTDNIITMWSRRGGGLMANTFINVITLRAYRYEFHVCARVRTCWRSGRRPDRVCAPRGLFTRPAGPPRTCAVAAERDRRPAVAYAPRPVNGADGVCRRKNQGNNSVNETRGRRVFRRTAGVRRALTSRSS